MIFNFISVGMSTGEASQAFYNAIFHIRLGMFSGERLPSLLKDADYYLQLANRFDHKLSHIYLSLYRVVISTLIDRSIMSESSSDPLANSNEAYLKAHYLSKMLICFWQGYTQRCQHFVDKLLQMKLLGSHNHVMVTFIRALNLFKIVKNKKETAARSAHVKKVYKEAYSALQTAEKLSRWNYSNKIQLLKAEYSSFRGCNEAAISSYGCAISLACSSR